MPKLLFTQQEIDDYVKDKYFHVFHKDSKEICESMCVHADGIYPAKLIDDRRPNEPLEVKEYRKKIFTAKTKPTFFKIFSSLQKIRRSSDWSIRYAGEFTKITEGEELEDYCEVNYPGFTSLTNWVFTIMLRKYLIDPNAVVLVAPLERNVEVNEYLKPIAQIFNSCHVIDFVDGDYAVLLNPMGSVYYSGNKPVKGKTYYVCTTTQILRYDQVNGRNQFELTDTYDHNMGILPAFKLKGVLINQCENMYLYESRIAGIIPELDEAIREYSDLQAAKVLHIYPERWEFTQQECTYCKGTMKRPNPKYTGPNCGCEAQIACDKCNNGYIVAGPYSKIMVRPAGMGEQQQIPNPPAGYVEKDVEIVKIMEEGVEKHIYNALCAINFEFLSKTPLAQSGIAKAYDGDEMNNSVHGIAEDIVSAMDNIYLRIAMIRYGAQYPIDEIKQMVPTVAVPEKFDIVSSSHTQEELKSAKESKLNPVIQSALEESFTTTRFNTEPEVRDRLMLILTLDPLANISEDDKMSRLSNKGITIETYVISSNIQEFVQRAIEENKGFIDFDITKQKEIMDKYAQEVIAESQPSIPVDTGLGPDGQPIGNSGGDLTGKIPLAVQQLSLAATRAAEAGDTELAATIKAKINQLLGKLVDAANPEIPIPA